MALLEMLDRAAERLRADFGETKAINHRLLKGETREDILRAFLTRHLPRRYSCGSGEIYSSKNDQVGPQTDIVVYDEVYSWGLFGPQEIPAVYPAESVYAAIEVKSEIDATALTDASEKAAAIKALPRPVPPEGTFAIDPYIRVHAGEGITLSGPPHRPILGVLFGYRSSMDDIDILKAVHRQAAIRDDAISLDLVCVLDKCVITHKTDTGLPVWSTDGRPAVLHAKEKALPVFLALLTATIRTIRLYQENPIYCLAPVLKHIPYHEVVSEGC